MGPFSRATGNRRWLLVATDYFTKWVEAKPLASIRDINVTRFVWKNIVMQFSVPRVLCRKMDCNLTVRLLGDTVQS